MNKNALSAPAEYRERPRPASTEVHAEVRARHHSESCSSSRRPAGPLRRRSRRRPAGSGPGPVPYSARGASSSAGTVNSWPGSASTTRFPISTVSPGVEHDPHLVAQSVVVRAGLGARADGHEPDRRHLVQHVGGEPCPRAVDDHGVLSLSCRARSRAGRSSRGRPRRPPIPGCRARRPREPAPARGPRSPAPRRCTGIPVLRETSAMPRAASFATRSKCAVSPRITAPRQMIAS